MVTGQANEPRKWVGGVDHLGNVRVRYVDKDNDGKILVKKDDPILNEIIGSTHYYPFGLATEGPWHKQEGAKNRYKYNGIEHVDEVISGLSFSTYRIHDAALGRWYQVDPKAEALYNMNPFNAMGNNPISYADPHGDLFTGAELAANVGGVLINAAFGAYNGNVGQFGMDLGLSIVNGLIAEANPLDWNMGAAGISAGASLTFQGGSEGISIGIEAGVSVGFGKFRFAQAYTGISLYTSNYGTNSIGGNFYIGAKIGFGIERGQNQIDGAWLGSTYFLDFAGETSQRIGGFYANIKGWKATYENDGFPYVEFGFGDNGDSFRTASISLGYKDFSANVNLFTGYRNFNEAPGKPEPGYPYGVVPNAEADKYREGILTFGYKNIRLGWNSEGIRHAIQNQGAHGLAKPQNYFRFLAGMPNRPVLGTDYGSKYHNW